MSFGGSNDEKSFSVCTTLNGKKYWSVSKLFDLVQQKQTFVSWDNKSTT